MKGPERALSIGPNKTGQQKQQSLQSCGHRRNLRRSTKKAVELAHASCYDTSHATEKYNMAISKNSATAENLSQEIQHNLSNPSLSNKSKPSSLFYHSTYPTKLTAKKQP